MLATLAVAVGLGAHSLGYQHGLQVERRAWEDTRETSLNSVTNRGIITQSMRIAYANPHSRNPLRGRIELTPVRAVNIVTRPFALTNDRP
jgi:hypothetical protein